MWDTTDKKLRSSIRHRARAVHRRNPWLGFDDLVQQAWLVVFEARGGYDPTKGPPEPWIEAVLKKKLNNYAGLCNTHVSAPSFRHFRRHSASPQIEDGISADYLLYLNHPEKLLIEAQTRKAIRNLVTSFLAPYPDGDALLRILTEKTTIQQETIDLTERNRLWKVLSRVRKQLRNLPTLQALFNRIKEASLED